MIYNWRSLAHRCYSLYDKTLNIGTTLYALQSILFGCVSVLFSKETRDYYRPSRGLDIVLVGRSLTSVQMQITF